MKIISENNEWQIIQEKLHSIDSEKPIGTYITLSQKGGESIVMEHNTDVSPEAPFCVIDFVFGKSHVNCDMFQFETENEAQMKIFELMGKYLNS